MLVGQETVSGSETLEETHLIPVGPRTPEVVGYWLEFVVWVHDPGEGKPFAWSSTTFVTATDTPVDAAQ